MMTGTTDAQYRALLTQFLPHTVKTEADYQAVQVEIDRLLDQGDLSAAEEDYLDLLGTLLAAYERTSEDQADYALHGIDLIKGLMELNGLKQNDLTPIFKTKSITSAVLNGQRRLTVEHINRLANFFKLPHSLFFAPAPGEQLPGPLAGQLTVLSPSPER